MGITLLSFVEWKGFNPGPLFPLSKQTSSFRYDWASKIPPGTETNLTAAIPSVLDAPSSEEWKKDISSIEWKTLSDIWVGVAQSILVNDPFFRPFQHSWYVTPNGVWTDQFRNHPTFGILVEELVVRLEEVFEFNDQLLKKIYEGVASSEAISLTEFDMPNLDESIAVASRWKWVKTVWRVGRIGVLFSPQGIGWIVAEEVARYGINKYREHRKEQKEREQERAERRQRLREKRNKNNPKHQLNGYATEVELPFGEWSFGNETINGFVPQQYRYLGQFTIESSPNPGYQWSKIFGAPTYLSSQDGIYL